MTRDYSQPDDPYGIAEYTNQSADRDVCVASKRIAYELHDARGNTLLTGRSVPTQAEADEVRR
jgi:hypothetical protein